MKQFFPWRLYWKFFFSITGVAAFVAFVGIIFASYLNGFSLLSLQNLILFIGLISLAALGASGVAYQFVMPMRSVILSALQITSKKSFNDSEEEDYEDILEEEPGEYFELELALRKIKRKLKKRRLQLAHEREESRALFSSLGDATLAIDLSERVKFYNSRFANQFLRDDQKNLKNEDQPLLLRELFRTPEIIQLYRNVFQSGKSQDLEVSLFSQIDGEDRIYRLRVSPLREEKSLQIYGALALFQDVTDFKRVEKIRNEFVENASHELRTPLTSIKGYLSALQDDLGEKRYDHAERFLGIVAKNVDRLILLVNDMLTIASLENGSSMVYENFSLAQLTEETLEKIQRLAVAKNMTLRYRCEVNQFYGDFAKIEQVLTNLVENAIKYVPERGEIEVIWSRSEQSISLQVIDNGPGIDEEHQARLFERFYRVDKGRSRDIGGTGLGLSIVKHIVQSHGGSVEVESRKGFGATFICRFPVNR